MRKQAFVKQLPMVIINKILHHDISFIRNTMIITNQLLRFYTLRYLRIQCFISRVLFIVDLVIYLLLMVLSYTLFSVLFKRLVTVLWIVPTLWTDVWSGMVIINLVGRLLTAIYSFCNFCCAIICSLGKFSSLKILVSLTQYRGTVGIFNNRLFFCALKYKNFSLIIHSQDHCFLDFDFHHNDIRFTFFLIFLMLLTLNCKTYKSSIYFSVLSFLIIAVNVSIATWVYSILISLSGDVQLNPSTKNKFDVNFSICH